MATIWSARRMTLTDSEKEKLTADIRLLVDIAVAIYTWADSDPTDERKLEVKARLFGQKEPMKEENQNDI